MIRPALLTFVGLAVASPARADRYEATVGVAAGAGAARIGEEGAPAAVVPALGVSARLAYAWRDALAWDLQLGVTATDRATFTNVRKLVSGRPEMGDVTRRAVTVDAQVGAELRLGSLWIPTIRIGLGPQVRHRSASDLGALAGAVPSSVTLDAVASVAVGLDLRLGARRVVGLALQLDHAQPLGGGDAHDVIGVVVRVSHSWYPRWWSPSW